MGAMPFAAMTTGTDTKPPFENTTSGFTLLMMRLAWNMPPTTLNGSVRFFSEKYLRSLPADMV